MMTIIGFNMFHEIATCEWFGYWS